MNRWTELAAERRRVTAATAKIAKTAEINRIAQTDGRFGAFGNFGTSPGEAEALPPQSFVNSERQSDPQSARPTSGAGFDDGHRTVAEQRATSSTIVADCQAASIEAADEIVPQRSAQLLRLVDIEIDSSHQQSSKGSASAPAAAATEPRSQLGLVAACEFLSILRHEFGSGELRWSIIIASYHQLADVHGWPKQNTTSLMQGLRSLGCQIGYRDLRRQGRGRSRVLRWTGPASARSRSVQLVLPFGICSLR